MTNALHDSWTDKALLDEFEHAICHAHVDPDGPPTTLREPKFPIAVLRAEIERRMDFNPFITSRE